MECVAFKESGLWNKIKDFWELSKLKIEVDDPKDVYGNDSCDSKGGLMSYNESFKLYKEAYSWTMLAKNLTKWWKFAQHN